jgi:UDP-N-acetyl-2-amino-2-deoxyglucuronate dehydrogenase
VLWAIWRSRRPRVPDDFEASLSFVCESGLAQIGGIAVNELQLFTPKPADCADHTEDFSGNVYGHGHVKIYEEIVGDLTGAAPYSVEGDDALKTIRLLNALYVAAETGQWVEVDRAPDSELLGRPSEELSAIYRTPTPS